MGRDRLHGVYNSSMHKSILSEQGSNLNLLVTETLAFFTFIILLICAKCKLFSERCTVLVSKVDDASKVQCVTS